MSAVASPPSSLEKAAALAGQGRLDEAEALARDRLSVDSEDPEALQLLAGIARVRGDRAAAVTLYSEAIRCRPGFAKAHTNLGATLLELGRVDEAIDEFRKALASDPAYWDARTNLGAALLNARRFEEAERELREVLATHPEDDLALSSLGNALFHQGRLDDAIAAFEEAIAREPNSALAINNLGTALREKGDRAKAEALFRRAVTVNPEFAEAWTHLGVVLRDQGRDREALAAYEKALAARAGFAPALFGRALIELGEGRFEEGFRDYLARPLRDNAPVNRKDLPHDLAGKHILLRSNQGLGDELFFLRFAPALKARGATLFYRTGISIASIVGRIGALDRVVTDDIAVPEHDLALSIGDLPHLLRVKTASDLPPPLRLSATDVERRAIAEKLERLGPPPYIGLTWRAGTREWNALLKFAPPTALGRALAGVPATFLSLQRAPDAGETEALSSALCAPVHDLSELNRSLESMLALLERIEIYVGVSNTNTHLRAGTGKIAHVLVPHPPEWRWMDEGDRSPWFPDFPLYRQKAADSPERGWDDALGRLARDVADHLRSGLR